MYRSLWKTLVSVFFWILTVGDFLDTSRLVERAAMASLDRAQIQILVVQLVHLPVLGFLGAYFWKQRLIPPPEYVKGGKGLLFDFAGFVLLLVAVVAGEIALAGAARAVAGFAFSWPVVGIGLAIAVPAGYGARYFRRKRILHVA